MLVLISPIALALICWDFDQQGRDQALSPKVWAKQIADWLMIIA